MIVSRQKNKPRLNKVVLRAIPDHQPRFASLLSGELDMIGLGLGSLIAWVRENVVDNACVAGNMNKRRPSMPAASDRRCVP